MTTLHVFNPEHDIALASNLANFTAPHAGRQLRADMGFLPSIWAKEDDFVLVDNVEHAEKACKRFRYRSCHRLVEVLPDSNIERISVWGWDKALKATLKRKGVSESLLPTDEQLEHIRQLSHRRTSARLLPLLQMKGTVGESFECTKSEEVETLLQKYGQIVLKAPWSGSGRGLRWVSQDLSAHDKAWLVKVVKEQRCVIAEPRWSVQYDFAFEYRIDKGVLTFVGLSLFDTANGVYRGNRLLSDDAIARLVGVPQSLRTELDGWLESNIVPYYQGPVGVDCICDRHGHFHISEINLRHTMGLVAHEYLRLHPQSEGSRFSPAASQ